ncbi:MAG: N-acetylmuramoyl-L-alanine amidase [Eubacteriales bacterium]|nr:N-acetylmuramoyl-L-alanine amidase [Eubacteriales bacterium]
MRFKTLAALLCAAALCAPPVAGAATSPVPDAPVAAQAAAPLARALKVALSTHKVQVNGRAVSPQAYNIDGHNYFKLRDVAYLLDGTSACFAVVWDGQRNAIDLRPGQHYTVVGGEMTTAAVSGLRVSASTAKVLLEGDGIAVKGYNINGNNYYKIANLAAAIGFVAAFDKPSWTVHLKTPSVVVPDTPAPDFVPSVYQVQVDTTLSIREGPGTTYARVGQLQNAEHVVVDGLTGIWAHLQDGRGYASTDYLIRVSDHVSPDPEPAPTPDPEPTPTPTPTPEPVQPDPAPTPAPPTGIDPEGQGTDQPPDEPAPFVAGYYRVGVDSTLSVRAGAGLTYPIVGRLLDGDEIVVDAVEDGWAHLVDTAKGAGRYCSMDYLTRVGDYTAGADDVPDDPVRPPRTSHIDGIMTVIVDAGHGGGDVGAHSPDLSMDEKHINLAVAQYLRDELERAGVRVIMVRDTLEDGGSLSLRGAVMKQYADTADLFFSIHHNAANTVARGAEALAQIADRNGGPSKILGEALLAEYEKLGVPIRGVVFKEGSYGDYYYTNRAAAALYLPALTSEFCFIDNEEDQAFIDSEDDLRAQAWAQYEAIMYYFTQVDY